MNDEITQSAVAGPGFPRLALGLAWVASLLVVGVLGWLLFAISDRRQDAFLGGLLLGLATLGFVAAATVAFNRYREMTLTFSMFASAAFVLTGIAGATVAAARADVFVADLVLVGGAPVLCGLVSAVLGLRARSMSRLDA